MRLNIIVAVMIQGFFSMSVPSNAQVNAKEDSVHAISQIKLNVEGMHCQAGCANGIDNMLKEQKGIVSSETLFDKSSSVIRYDSEMISEKDIIALIEDRGFKAKKKTDLEKD